MKYSENIKCYILGFKILSDADSTMTVCLPRRDFPKVLQRLPAKGGYPPWADGAPAEVHDWVCMERWREGMCTFQKASSQTQVSTSEILTPILFPSLFSTVSNHLCSFKKICLLLTRSFVSNICRRSACRVSIFSCSLWLKAPALKTQSQI